MTNLNQYDFVIYGATGFTGKLVVEYVINQYGNNNDISWAIAGRNKEKLEEVLEENGVDVDTSVKAIKKAFVKANPVQLFLESTSHSKHFQFVSACFKRNSPQR